MTQARGRQRLLEPVADEPLRLGDQGVEGIGAGQRVVVTALEGQQADLRAVAVGDDDVVGGGRRRQGRRRLGDVLELHGGVRRLASPEQGVATEGDQDAHRDPPGAVGMTRVFTIVEGRVTLGPSTRPAGS